jgi:hypothetical protein
MNDPKQLRIPEMKPIGLRMAKASPEDIEAAIIVNGILSDVLEDDAMPRDAKGEHPERMEMFDPDSYDDLRHFYDVLYEAYRSRAGGMNRVVWGMDILLNPDNNLVDPDADHLAPHPDIAALSTKLETARKTLEALLIQCWKGSSNEKLIQDTLKATA